MSLQFEFVCNLRGDLFEADGRAGYPLEPDPVEGETGQLAHLYLPLDQGVGVGVPVDAQQQEPFSLFVITTVGIQDLVTREREREIQGQFFSIEPRSIHDTKV